MKKALAYILCSSAIAIAVSALAADNTAAQTSKTSAATLLSKQQRFEHLNIKLDDGSISDQEMDELSHLSDELLA